jgi:hypothetical protein
MINTAKSFQTACVKGNLNTVQELYHCISMTNIATGFSRACTYGHLNLAQWLYETNPHYINIDDDDTFIWTCAYGYLDVAQWLYELCPNLNTAEDAFIYACGNGYYNEENIGVAQWLASLPNNYSPSTYESAFMHASITNRLDVVKWLHSIQGETITNYMANNPLVFMETCKNNSRAHVAKWWQSLMPFKYGVNTVICDDNEITNYYVRSDIEARRIALIYMLSNYKMDASLMLKL